MLTVLPQPLLFRGTDANTGIFFGTDIIGFSEGGVEAMRIDSDSTAQSTTSTSYQASGLTLSITPTSSTSKILISASVPYDSFSGTLNQASLTLYRGATNLITNGFSLLSGGSGLNLQAGSSALSWLDSPATTSSTTYTIYFRVTTNASGPCTARVFVDGYTGSLTAMEIAA
jgi:hypothetical protein